MSNIKIKIKSRVNEESKKEDEYRDIGIHPDDIGIPRHMKRLQSGIMEKPVKPSQEEIYRQSKILRQLQSKIKRLIPIVKALERRRAELSQNQPSLDRILQIANEIIKTSKGKYGDDEK